MLYAAGSAALPRARFRPAGPRSTHCGRSASSPAASWPRPGADGAGRGARGRAALAERLETALGGRQRRANGWRWSYCPAEEAEPTTRKVDPYGLALRRGVWSLVGYCHLRAGAADLPRPPHPRAEDEHQQATDATTSRCRRTSSSTRTCRSSLAVGHRVAGRGAARAAGPARDPGRRAFPRRAAGAHGRSHRGGAQRHPSGRAAASTCSSLLAAARVLSPEPAAARAGRASAPRRSPHGMEGKA